MLSFRGTVHQKNVRFFGRDICAVTFFSNAVVIRRVSIDERKYRQELMEATPTSYTPAHERTVTVAPFRAWRGSQCFIAGEPARVTITRRVLSLIAGLDSREFMGPFMQYAGKLMKV